VSHPKLQIPSLQPLLGEGHSIVVGTLHEPKALALLKKQGSRLQAALDVLEARLDHVGADKLPSRWPLPVIATARHPEEGGAGNLRALERRRLLTEALPWAAAIDVELRSARALSPVIAEAHQHGRTVILSHHDFSATPTLASLRKLARRASDAGADLFKVATTLRDPDDLRRLIDFQSATLPIPVTTMGMGPAGKFSRLVLCGFGAPLCYGWLGAPQVPGQWPALELKGMLAEVLPT
jgi:3-dehydroquinate dehydratase-1